MSADGRAGARAAAPAAWRNVWLLAVTSLISDVSGEMLQAVLPFLLVAQGASGVGLGLTGGATEMAGHAFKLVGGYWGARVRRKRPLVAAGYLLAALSRFGVALAGSWPVSLGFRSLDRVGKGIREAPRDTLLADGVPAAERGRAFGLHRTGDTLGAVIGVVAALYLVSVWYRPEGAGGGATGWRGLGLESSVVLVGAVIGLAAVVPLAFLREAAPDGLARAPFEPLAPRYRGYLAVAGLFYLSHVSYLFFILRAAEGPAGSLPPIAAGVLWYLFFNVVYVALSYPAGMLADRVGRVRVLALGYGLAALSCLAFVAPPSLPSLALGFAGLGASYAATEGMGRAVAADLAGSAARSHRLGWYHFTVGVGTLLGSLAAGLLWDVAGPAWAFGWGAAVASVGLAAITLWGARGKAWPGPRAPPAGGA